MKNITHDEISFLDNFVPYPMIAYNQDKVAFFNERFKELDIDENYMTKYAKVHPIKEFIKNDLIFFTRHKEKKAFSLSSEPVTIEGEDYYLSYFVDITDKKKEEQELRKIKVTREGLLEINRIIIDSDDIHLVLNNVLKNTLKALDKGDYGAVFILDNEILKLVTYLGFGKEIEKVSLSIKDSFIYIATEGKLDRIVISSDKKKFEKSFPGMNSESVITQSVILAPLYSNNIFFGTIGIYSTMKDAFDKDDMKAMEFVRNNIEIAVANRMTNTEKEFESKYESLTRVYNWEFIITQYSCFKERAIKNNRTFHVVMINIDRLKRTNNYYGHLAGDEVILRIAAELFKIVSKNDVLIRFAGDEFIGFFYNTNAERLSHRFDGLNRNMKGDPIVFKTSVLAPSFTYGISCFPEDGENLEDLVNMADKRMNIEKIKG